MRAVAQQGRTGSSPDGSERSGPPISVVRAVNLDNVKTVIFKTKQISTCILCFAPPPIFFFLAKSTYSGLQRTVIVLSWMCPSIDLDYASWLRLGLPVQATLSHDLSLPVVGSATIHHRNNPRPTSTVPLLRDFLHICQDYLCFKALSTNCRHAVF